MPLTAGARVGPYDVVSPLGVGGMGEVHPRDDKELFYLGRHEADGGSDGRARPDVFAAVQHRPQWVEELKSRLEP